MTPPAAVAAQPQPEVFAEALRELGLAGPGPLSGAPLTGGVSSDIWRVDIADGPVCAKRALARLRVEADWRAPIERNRYEARWLQAANAVEPGCAPEVLGQHSRLGVLVMARGERMAKWNEALHTEQRLGGRARFAGGAGLGLRCGSLP
jgi:hypothetical protein